MNADLERLLDIRRQMEFVKNHPDQYAMDESTVNEFNQLKEKIEKSLEGIQGRDFLIKRLQEEGLKNIMIVEKLKEYKQFECNPAYEWSAKKVYNDLKEILGEK